MKIIHVNPPILDNQPGFHYRLNQPIGANILNAILEQRGHEVAYIDAEALELSTEDAAKLILKQEPHAVGITATTRNYPSTVAFIGKLRQLKPQIYIAIGGPHCSALPQECAEKSGADAIVIGEADLNICDIFENQPKGIVQGQMPTDLGALPIPAWHRAVPKVNQYLGNIPRFAAPEGCNLWNRACLFAKLCKFCSLPVYRGKPVRYLPPEKIVEETRLLLDTYHIQHLFVYSDSLFGNNAECNSWLASVCQAIRKANLDFTWKTQGHPSKRFNTIEVLEAAYAAGCRAIMVGIEAASQKVLDAIGKHITLEDIEATLENMKKAKIDCFGFFMVGCLEETEEEFQKTLKRAAEFKRRKLIRWSQVTVMSCEPGSQLWDMAKKNNWFVEDFKPNWYHYEASLNLPWASRERINQRREELARVLA